MIAKELDMLTDEELKIEYEKARENYFYIQALIQTRKVIKLVEEQEKNRDAHF
jgi:hypothetical protein